MIPTNQPSRFRRLFTSEPFEENGRRWIDGQGWIIALAVAVGLATAAYLVASFT